MTDETGKADTRKDARVKEGNEFFRRTGLVDAFLNSLAFFTLLAPGRVLPEGALGRCATMLFPCGLVVGGLCTLAAFTALTALRWCTVETLPKEFSVLLPLLAGFVWIVCEIWLTRGLHWDAVADMADALGSCKRGDAFRAVLKDSRTGAFGVLGLLVVFLVQLLACATHVAEGQWLPLVLAPAWGKALALPLFVLAHPHDIHSLGGQFASAGTRSNLFICLAFGLAACCVLIALNGTGLISLGVLILGQALLVLRFVSWSRMHDGYSGDFAGALMLGGQCLFIFATI